MFTSKTPLEKLKNKSSNILMVFTKTIHGLMEVNDQTQQELDYNNEAIKKLQEENSQLQGIQEGNQKIIDKIESFLQD